MKIAVLNECFLNETHLKRLSHFGKIEVFPNTKTSNEVISRLKGVDIAVIDGFIAPLNKKVLSNADKLKLLVLPHNSFAMVDLQTAKNKNIAVVNSPGFSIRSVAELVIGLIFAVSRKMISADKAVRNGLFNLDPSDRSFDKYWGSNIEGKTMGVIGFGRIGSTVAKLAYGLGMNVIAFNRSQKKTKNVEMVSMEDVLRRADVISIHLSLNPETKHIISDEQFNLMKPTSILINTAAAKHVHVDTLYKALRNKKIAGAGLDVVDGIDANHPILKLENVVFTPHSASYTNESFRENLPNIVVSNIENFLKGKPSNVVN